jgi:hypothetical protein
MTQGTERPADAGDLRRPGSNGATHKLLVLYPEPADPDHFREYYVTQHLPLVTRLPGLLAWRYGFDVAAIQGQTPYFASSRPSSLTRRR